MPSSYPYLSRKLVLEPFHDPELLEAVWTSRWGADNPIGPLRLVLMHAPSEEVLLLHDHAGAIESGPVLLQHIRGKPSKSNGTAAPKLKRLQAQHQALAAALEKEGVRILWLDPPDKPWPEMMYTRDLGMVIPGGVILSRLALYVRYGETALAARTLGAAGVPILGMIQGGGFAEGGSFVMLDRQTAVLGRSERVNPEGIEQVRHILSLQQIELLVIDLPASIIHLDEAFLMVDRRKALVNIALLPYWFLEELHGRGFELLHVDPRDPALTINGLTLAPGKVLFSADGKHTIDLLSSQGVQVIPVETSEIAKMGGGIHCCTLPLIREPLL
ncbi:MAG: arginine deiminase family protein [Paenibacillus sp.]|uniref:dimethylarginine dimethylaminohydrolase family protein n=1 Tax=Paenibacillus sp. TaxID=58172 RepID=UPI0029119F41|nr:arginine deiminase family protein [Paenibacillus sp.]MDU4694315.1 arginine deiminase family protein [Paenibacillus sp.]